MHNLLQGLVSEAAELKEFLSNSGQLSLLRFAGDNARKALVLSAASLFEHRVTEALLGYTDRVTHSDGCIVSMVRIKAIMTHCDQVLSAAFLQGDNLAL